MPSWIAWVQTLSGLIKMGLSPSAFKRGYLGREYFMEVNINYQSKSLSDTSVSQKHLFILTDSPDK
jgi:hypothetical protein